MGALLLYRGLTGIGGPMIEYLLRRRLARGKEDSQRLAERRGIASLPRPAGKLVWLHAASVGEAQSSLALIARFLDGDPALHVLLTTGTVTSACLMAERLPPRSFHQYAPLDRLPWVRRFFDHWRPDLALWMESELWPNLVTEARRRNIPTILVNARMSSRTYARWRRLSGTARELIGGFAMCLAQTAEQAERLRQLGAGQAKCLGNLKFSAAALPADPTEVERLRDMIGDRPLWLAASTHPGEEEMAARAHRALAPSHPGLLTVVVPRHPDRGDEVAATLAGLGLRVNRRSEGRPIAADDAVYLADTLGELGLFYRLAGIAFVGGSTAAHGGHNPLEAAQLGCAVIHGPDMANFASVAHDLAAAGGAVEVAGAAALGAAVGRFLDDAEARRRCAEAGAGVAAASADAVERIYAEIATFMSGRDGHASAGVLA